MKYATSELTGALLDAAVAKAEGANVLRKEDGTYSIFWAIEPARICWADYAPSTDWSQGGPIIERERISVDPELERGDWYGQWRAVRLGWEGQGTRDAMGETPLIAAMRAYVASKLGEEVDLP